MTTNHTWQHAANEWADATCNALQWMKNVSGGISTPHEAIKAIESDIQHCRDTQPGTDELTRLHAENSKLKAELEAVKKQKPVAYWNGVDMFCDAKTVGDIPNWSDYYQHPLYAAPVHSDRSTIRAILAAVEDGDDLEAARLVCEALRK